MKDIVPINANDIRELLTDFFIDHPGIQGQYGDPLEVRGVAYYEAAGLLTSDKGLVVTLENGQRVQLTVTVL